MLLLLDIHPSIRPPIFHHRLSCSRGCAGAWSPCGEWFRFCLSRIRFPRREKTAFGALGEKGWDGRRLVFPIISHVKREGSSALLQTSTLFVSRWVTDGRLLVYLFVNMCAGVYSVAPARLCVCVWFPSVFLEGFIANALFEMFIEVKLLSPPISSWFRNVGLHPSVSTCLLFWYLKHKYYFKLMLFVSALSTISIFFCCKYTTWHKPPVRFTLTVHWIHLKWRLPPGGKIQNLTKKRHHGLEEAFSYAERDTYLRQHGSYVPSWSYNMGSNWPSRPSWVHRATCWRFCLVSFSTLLSSCLLNRIVRHCGHWCVCALCFGKNPFNWLLTVVFFGSFLSLHLDLC